MTTIQIEAKPVTETPSQPAVVAPGDKGVEILKVLDEFHCQQNVSTFFDGNHGSVNANAMIPVILNADVDFFTDFELKGRLHECRGLTAKDDFGRQSGRYGIYEVHDLDDAVLFCAAVAKTKGLTIAKTAEFSNEQNPSFCLGERAGQFKVTVSWKYYNSKDKVGHFDSILAIEFKDVDKYPKGHAVRKFNRFVEGLNAKMRSL